MAVRGKFSLGLACAEKEDASQLQVEQSRAPFGNRQRAAIEATVRHMAELTEPELNLVAAVARALARKGSFRPSLTHTPSAASDAKGDNKD